MLYGCLLSSLEIKALVADKKKRKTKVERYRFIIKTTENMEHGYSKSEFTVRNLISYLSSLSRKMQRRYSYPCVNSERKVSCIGSKLKGDQTKICHSNIVFMKRKQEQKTRKTHFVENNLIDSIYLIIYPKDKLRTLS